MGKSKSGFSTKQLVSLMGKKVRADSLPRYGGSKKVEGWLVGSTYSRRVVTEYELGERLSTYVPGTSRHVFLVRPWPTCKTVDVNPSSLEVLPDDYEVTYPHWYPEYHEDASNAAKEQARDARGRFRAKTISSKGKTDND